MWGLENTFSMLLVNSAKKGVLVGKLVLYIKL